MEADAAHIASVDPRLATPSRRLAAWAIDAIILGVVMAPLNPVLYSDRPSRGLFLVLIVPSLALAFLYLVLFDGGTRGATPGKRILRIRVADESIGDAIGYRRAVVRRLGYVVGGLAVYIGWLWLLFDARRQAWHDKLADTVVVRT